MKVSRNKILSIIVGGVIIAGTGGYALADQASHPSVVTASSAMTSSVISQGPSASETEVASKMNESSAVPLGTSKAPVSEPAKVNSSSGVTSMQRNVLYYNIIDPDTGRTVQPRNAHYFEIRNKLGGDAGTVPPDESTACQAALKAYKAKQAANGVSDID